MPLLAGIATHGALEAIHLLEKGTPSCVTGCVCGLAQRETLCSTFLG